MPCHHIDWYFNPSCGPQLVRHISPDGGRCPQATVEQYNGLHQTFSSNSHDWIQTYPVRNTQQAAGGSLGASSSASTFTLFRDVGHIPGSSGVAGNSHLNDLNGGESTSGSTSFSPTLYPIWRSDDYQAQLGISCHVNEDISADNIWMSSGAQNTSLDQLSFFLYTGVGRSNMVCLRMPASTEKKYRCSKCPKKFTRDDARKRHEKLKCRGRGSDVAPIVSSTVTVTADTWQQIPAPLIEFGD